MADILDGVPIPIVQAPMAGASTPDMAAAASRRGALGFLAAGYTSAEAMSARIADVRARTSAPFGVNLFVPGPDTADPGAVRAYTERLRPEAARLGASPGEPVWSGAGYEAKLAALRADPVALVSFTFGCPSPEAVAQLRARGSRVIVTVTTGEEARAAAAAGADAVCAQGAEAGGHQGSFDDTRERTAPLMRLLAEVRAAVSLPVIAAGGISDAAKVRAVLEAGAVAAQVGTAFLRCVESAASDTHKAALADPRYTETAVTRAFSGRWARGLVNRFMTEHGAAAPRAYPQVHYLTAPLRTAAAAAGDAGTLHLWAGTGYGLARECPVAEVIAGLLGERVAGATGS